MLVLKRNKILFRTVVACKYFFAAYKPWSAISAFFISEFAFFSGNIIFLNMVSSYKNSNLFTQTASFGVLFSNNLILNVMTLKLLFIKHFLIVWILLNEAE